VRWLESIATHSEEGAATTARGALALLVSAVDNRAMEQPVDLRGLEHLAPSQTAILLVDFQNDFCSPGVFHDSPVTNTQNAATAHRANDFASKAAALGAHVIYSQQILDLSKLTPRQRRRERPDGLCAVGSWGAELFIQPVPGAHIVTKYRFDIWQSRDFTDRLDTLKVEGLVIGGVELCSCVLYAVLGAEERGYDYLVAQDLVSGQDPGADTYNRAVREYLRITHGAIDTAQSLLKLWADQ
jgi:nicotinamidase-related amidase